MDLSTIVSLVSVITSAAVTVINLYISAAAQKDANQQKYRYELELENLRSQNETKEKARDTQYKVVSEMSHYCLEMMKDPDNYRDTIYTLALQLAACSNPHDIVGESAQSLIKALTDNYKDKEKIKWNYLIESCARSVNAQSLAESSLPQSTTVQRPDTHTSPHRKERQQRFAKGGKAFLSGWRESQNKI